MFTPDRRLRRRLAAMARRASTPDGARGDARVAAGAAPPARPQPDDQGGWSRCWRCSSLFATPLPREIGALIIAALLLANRKITSRTMIAAVDWPLLLLVVCLFAITGALNRSGIAAAHRLDFLHEHGLLPDSLAAADAAVAARTSNTIGSVPCGDAVAADLAEPAAGRALRAGAVVEPRRQSAADRQPDQRADRRARRALWRAASASPNMPAPAFRSRSCRSALRCFGSPGPAGCRCCLGSAALSASARRRLLDVRPRRRRGCGRCAWRDRARHRRGGRSRPPARPDDSRRRRSTA